MRNVEISIRSNKFVVFFKEHVPISGHKLNLSRSKYYRNSQTCNDELCFTNRARTSDMYTGSIGGSSPMVRCTNVAIRMIEIENNMGFFMWDVVLF